MTTTASRNVAKVVRAFETAEGAGATVRRSIGSMNLHRLDPFLVLDHFYLPPGSGFPDHPHRGQATVTYMFEGSVQHEDSAGHKGTIGPGDLQWMIAGKGIIHAESEILIHLVSVGLLNRSTLSVPVHGPGLSDPTGLQLWIDLPQSDKMTTPSYQELISSQVPTAYPLGRDGPVEVKVISGKSFGEESPVRHIGGCWYLDIHLKVRKEGKVEFFQEIPKGWTAFMYTIEGNIAVNTQVIDKNYTVVLSSEEMEDGVLLSLDGDQDARAVLIAGAPLNQPVVQYGPFVMCSKEELMATLRDYDGQRNGFEKSKTWKSSIGGR